MARDERELGQQPVRRFADIAHQRAGVAQRQSAPPATKNACTVLFTGINAPCESSASTEKRMTCGRTRLVGVPSSVSLGPQAKSQACQTIFPSISNWQAGWAAASDRDRH